MGIDTTGEMIVGASMQDILKNKKMKNKEMEIVRDFEDCIENNQLADWAEENCMDYISPWYDCGPDYWIIGYTIADVEAYKMDDKWLESIQEKANKFKELTGMRAKLMGSANVW